MSRWEKGRVEHYRKRGIEMEKWRNRKDREEWRTQDMTEKEKGMQREMGKNKKISRYNEWYKWIKGKGVPKYLKKKMEKK